MKYLSLEIRQVDGIEVHQTDRAHSRGREVERGWRPESAGAHQQHTRSLQSALPFFTHLWQQDVAAVTNQLFATQRSGLTVGFGVSTHDIFALCEPRELKWIR